MAATQKAGAQAIARAVIRAALDAHPEDNVTLAVVRRLGTAGTG
jgi:serine/threonine protein phosphatase PrpC